MPPNDPTRTIVFDLDDTLYLEQDYVGSGKRAVARLIFELYEIDLADALLACPADFIGLACAEAKLPSTARDSLLWHYRLHAPDISLRPGMAQLIKALVERGDRVCVLTDGRTVTQRQKLRALGLGHIPAFVSEEVGGTKPAPTGFLQIMARYPAAQYTYVGDNCRKDFVAPRALGWRSIWLEPGPGSIHQAPPDVVPSGVGQPDLHAHTVEALAELLLATA